MARQMTLVGFLQAQNCTNFGGRLAPSGRAHDFTSAAYYQRSAGPGGGKIPARLLRRSPRDARHFGGNPRGRCQWRPV